MRAPDGILCFDGAVKRRKVAVKRIESQVRSADVVKWFAGLSVPRLRHTVRSRARQRRVIFICSRPVSNFPFSPQKPMRFMHMPIASTHRMVSSMLLVKRNHEAKIDEFMIKHTT